MSDRNCIPADYPKLKPLTRSVLILAAFLLFFVAWYFSLGIRPMKAILGDSQTVHYLLNYISAGIIPAAALWLLHRPCEIVPSLGLAHGFGTGALFALLATLPMLAGYACIGTFNRGISADDLLTRVLIAGFFEELIFRGFTFGQLFRYAHWGFLPAALTTSVAFGTLHLYQGHDLLSALGAFGVTAAGSLFFCWIYVEWKYNLWCIIWLHTLMNLPWIVFGVSTSGALGGIAANVLRFGTIVIAIGLTIVYKKQRGLPYFINIKTLVFKHA